MYKILSRPVQKKGLCVKRPCFKHQLDLICKTGLVLADLFCAELQLPGKYFSTIAKGTNNWRCTGFPTKIYDKCVEHAIGDEDDELRALELAHKFFK